LIIACGFGSSSFDLLIESVDRPIELFAESPACFGEQPHLSYDVFGADVSKCRRISLTAPSNTRRRSSSVMRETFLNAGAKSNRRTPEFDSKRCS
jgi:hypothetical protein